MQTNSFGSHMYNGEEISSQMKLSVWNSYYGSKKTIGKCSCVNCINYVTSNSFYCAMYLSSKNGGTKQPGNLKPVCASCYSVLKDKSIEEIQIPYSYNSIFWIDDPMDTSD